MYRYVQELQGFSPTESFALRLGGERLQAPNARLCDSNAKPYTVLKYELVSLCGGSKVNNEPLKLPANNTSEAQGILSRGGDDDEDLLPHNESRLE